MVCRAPAEAAEVEEADVGAVGPLVEDEDGFRRVASYTDEVHYYLVCNVDNSEIDIQNLLKDSALMITDYSSVFMDFAYMEKPEIYFQFDEDQFRSTHYAKGYFDYKKDEIIGLCQRYHCRAYICVNPKPVLNVLFSLQSIVMENIKNEVNGGSSTLLKGMLDSAIMKSGSNGNKFWIIDVDTQDLDEIQLAYNKINNAKSDFTGKNIIATIDTAHGCHFITHTFDIRVMEHIGVPAELKKEGLTLLYAYLDK